jgi:hypothetical protein
MPTNRTRVAQEAQNVCRPRSIAELEALGFTRAMVRGPSWRRTSYGFYVPTDAGCTAGRRSPLQRIIEAGPLIPPTGALTGWVPAYLAGVAYVDGRDARTLEELPIPICLGQDVGRERKGEWRFLRNDLATADVGPIRIRVRDALSGTAGEVVLPVTTPNRAVFDGVQQADGLGEAVAFVDACANAAWIILDGLTAYVSTRKGARGIGVVREAVNLADPAARSPWESSLRVFYIKVAGLPRPLVNVPVFDLDGRLLGIADLLDQDAGLVTEFDGSEHRDARRHRDDNDREELFEDANLVVVRAGSLDMKRYERRLIDRLRSGHTRGMARDRSKDRWTLVEPDWWVEEHADVRLTDEEKAALYGG